MEKINEPEIISPISDGSLVDGIETDIEEQTLPQQIKTSPHENNMNTDQESSSPLFSQQTNYNTTQNDVNNEQDSSISLESVSNTNRNNNRTNPVTNENNETEYILLTQHVYLIKLWRRSCIFMTLYCLPMIIIICAILGAQWSQASSCKKPIRSWLLILAIHHLLVVIVNITSYRKLPRPQDPPYVIEMRVRNSFIYYFINRALDFFWFVWFIFGISWTFRSECQDDAPHLIGFCIGLVVLHSIVFCWAVCSCCCTSCSLLSQVMYPNGPPVGGATKKQIKSLPSRKFHESDIGTWVSTKEDAVCAICLGEYEEKEELRILPCKHHFHCECVDQWLLQNKSCPLCKAVIDETIEPTSPKQSDLV